MCLFGDSTRLVLNLFFWNFVGGGEGGSKKAFGMSGYIMDFDDFLRGCAPCLELGGRFVSPYWGGGFEMEWEGVELRA